MVSILDYQSELFDCWQEEGVGIFKLKTNVFNIATDLDIKDRFFSLQLNLYLYTPYGYTAL